MTNTRKVPAQSYRAAVWVEAHHVPSDVELARAFERTLAAEGEDGSGADVAAAWAAWQTEHLEHLEHEEKVMMPLTMKTAATPEERARIVHERLLGPVADKPEFEPFLQWVVTRLGQGSSGQPAAVAVRVFVWGLQHASSQAQWARWLPVVQASCAPAVWEVLVSKFQIDGPGKIA